MTENHDPDLISDAVSERSSKENRTRRRMDAVHDPNQGHSVPSGEADQSVTVDSPAPSRRRDDHGDGEETRPNAVSEYARPFSWSVIAAVVVAVAALMLSAVTWYFQNPLSSDVRLAQEKRLEVLHRQILTIQQEHKNEVEDVTRYQQVAEERYQKFQAEMAAVGASVNAQLSQTVTEQAALSGDLRSEVERLADKVGDPKAEEHERTRLLFWQLFDVEQLLTLAHRRFLLLGDTEVVSKALKLINHDLASIDDPRVLPLRRRLVDEWSQLRAMPQPDVDGAVLEVSSLVDAIDHLPLKGWVPSDDAPMSDDQIDQNGHKSWFHQVLSDVRGLIKIRRIDETRLPALSNEGQFVIRETLRLRLTLLQIALVNRDPAGIARDLSVAKAWVESYFEATDPSVMQFAARLDALSGLELAPNPIDLSEVLTIVRQMRHTVRDDP
jgi:uncharacterized protein HemX